MLDPELLKRTALLGNQCRAQHHLPTVMNPGPELSKLWRCGLRKIDSGIELQTGTTSTPPVLVHPIHNHSVKIKDQQTG